MKKSFAVLAALLLLVVFVSGVGATTTTTSTSSSTTSTTSTSTLPPGHSSTRSSLNSKYVTTTNNTATNTVSIFTERNKVYVIDYFWLARETNGANQGKAIANECFAVAENIAGTLTVSSSSCGTAKGSLAGTSVAAATDGGVNFLITVTGNASEIIDWAVTSKVTVNDGVNVTTTTTTSTTTSTSSTTSTT